jgi:hypothetical protein
MYMQKQVPVTWHSTLTPPYRQVRSKIGQGGFMFLPTPVHLFNQFLPVSLLPENYFSVLEVKVRVTN